MLSIDLKYAAPDDSVTQRINEAIVRMTFEYEGVAPRAAADSFATAYVKRYHQELMPYYMEEQQKGEVGAWYNYVYELTTSLVSAQDSVWGYRFERVTYEGGAHGNHTINYVNFDKATGQQIALDDVFVADYGRGPRCIRRRTFCWAPTACTSITMPTRLRLMPSALRN